MSLLPPDLLRRNLIGILVVLAALAAYYLTNVASDLTRYRGQHTPQATAAPGGSAESGGLTWRIDSVTRLDELPGPLAEQLPAGTAAQVVTITRTGSGPDVACNAVLTDGPRRWQNQRLTPYNVPPPPGTTTDCSAPGPVQFTFVVPRQATPTAVDVVGYDGRIMVRLAQ